MPERTVDDEGVTQLDFACGSFRGLPPGGNAVPVLALLSIRHTLGGEADGGQSDAALQILHFRLFPNDSDQAGLVAARHLLDILLSVAHVDFAHPMVKAI